MAISTYSLGASGDIPSLGDFDGDGKADLDLPPPDGTLVGASLGRKGMALAGQQRLESPGISRCQPI